MVTDIRKLCTLLASCLLYAHGVTCKNELQWLPFKKNRLYSLIHVHILGAYVHICAKYEVSVTKPVDRTVHR